MSTYDHTKVVAKQNNLLSEGVVLHCAAAGISGFAAQAACNPADVLKSRVMSAIHAAGADATVPTVGGVAMHIMRHEGPGAFLKVGTLHRNPTCCHPIHCLWKRIDLCLTSVIGALYRALHPPMLALARQSSCKCQSWKL